MNKLTKSELDSMKEDLSSVISERSSWHDLDEDIAKDKDEQSYIDSIEVNDKDPYNDCVNLLLKSQDISGIEIQGWTTFLDPRRKFKFDTYDEKKNTNQRSMC